VVYFSQLLNKKGVARMNYDDKTDADINAMVSLLEGKEFIQENGLVYAGGMLYDPCNIPNDAWPIILENDIYMGPANWLKGGTTSWEAFVMFDQCVLAECEHANPLRAAMIVYLKMNEDKS
jgi:hypothetical protein